MNNNKRFIVKMLGVFNMQVENFTPKQVNKTLWTVAKTIMLIVFVAQIPEIITAVRWW